jgi:hypothetical protein
MGAVAVIVPVALLLVGGVAAAAGAQKKKQAAAAAAEGATPGAAATAPAAATPAAATPAATAPAPSILPGAQVPTVATVTGVPADVQALVIAAITSQNPVTMRRAADQLEAKYPLQAADLRKTAATFETAMAAAQGTTAATAAATTAAQQIAAAAQAASAAANVPGMPVAVPTTTNVPTAATTTLPPLSTMPTPTTTAAPAAADPNRVRAAALVVRLKTAKKGTSSEPRAQVKEFQLVERLSKADGSYGSETALALADKYGIVPPKPLFWGKSTKEGGTYQTLLDDKNAYSAHLLNLATKDPQRADEWRSAAKV